MTVKLLTEHHLEFLSLKVGCIGSSESTHVKISHCWKSHVAAHYEDSACMITEMLFTRDLSVFHTNSLILLDTFVSIRKH